MEWHRNPPRRQAAVATQTRFDGFPEDDDEDTPVELSVEKLAALAKQRLRRAQQEVHQLQFEVRNLLAGAEGERTLAEEAKKFLAQWVDAPWHFLFDRKWPGTSDSNIDLIVVGPPGVFVVDVKNWTSAKAERGKLLVNGFDCTSKLSGNRAQARAVNRLLTPLGIPAGGVIPVVILAQSVATSKKIANVFVAGMSHFASTLLREPSRYNREEIDDLANLLDRSLPHCIQARFDELESCELPHDAPVFSTGDLLEAAGSHQERLRWMVRMHPSQADFTTKVFHGPARLSGSAGTGKTVAALHRAHARSQEPGERVLFLSPTKILTQQHEAMLLQLGGGRSSVRCSTLPRWCTKFLRNRRIQT
jgi:Nuclease-related domain